MSSKVVLITGCSLGGIGYAMAEEFAGRANTTVYATARTLSSLETLPASVHRHVLDVTSKEGCEKVVEFILAEAGQIDILVNNAGAGAAGPACEFPIEDARSCFDINVFAPMRLTQLVMPSMAARKTGLIVNIGSIVGLVPTPWAGVYAASKAALHSWSEVLRMEVKGLGVDVLLVAPGAITSKFGKKQSDSFTMKSDSLFKSVAASIEERAQMSQRSDHSLPAAVLAKGIADRALRRNTPALYSAGGKAALFWILERLPRWLVWRMLSRSLGCDGVGK